MTATPEVILYTDGACSGNPGPGGWGAILTHVATGKSKEFSGAAPETTNNRMELTAAIEGLRTLDDSRRWRVHLVSDSKYVIDGLRSWIANWIKNNWRRGAKAGSPPVKNADLWKMLYELEQRHELTYEHVRGHTGHPENERCDKLATDAIAAQRGL